MVFVSGSRGAVHVQSVLTPPSSDRFTPPRGDLLTLQTILVCNSGAQLCW